MTWVSALLDLIGCQTLTLVAVRNRPPQTLKYNRILFLIHIRCVPNPGRCPPLKDSGTQAPFLRVRHPKVSYYLHSDCGRRECGESTCACRSWSEVNVSVSAHIPLTRARCEATTGCKVKLENTILGGKALSRTLFQAWRTQIPVIIQLALSQISVSDTEHGHCREPVWE